MRNQKVAAGALFISSKTGQALFSLRAPYKTHKLTWSLWGGMVEDGEWPNEAVKRECVEEMGFLPDIKSMYPFDVYESKDKAFRYYTFVCIVEDEFMPQLNQEAVGYAWVEVGLWPKPMHTGAQKTLCSKKGQEFLEMIMRQHSIT
jgi:ADP-ribose pyrophosphatase YjhB (NUDIX family)